MYCEKCGRLAHGDRPCGEMVQYQSGEVANGPPPPPFARPITGATMVVVAPPQPRLLASGWFARSFLATTGVLAALLAIPAGLMLLLVVVGLTNRQNTQPSDDLTTQATKLIEPVLTSYGIAQLLPGSHARRHGDEVVLIGHGRSGKQPHTYTVWFTAPPNGENWSVDTVIIDGHEYVLENGQLLPLDRREGF